jgi:hypothetical protein
MPDFFGKTIDAGLVARIVKAYNIREGILQIDGVTPNKDVAGDDLKPLTPPQVRKLIRSEMFKEVRKIVIDTEQRAAQRIAESGIDFDLNEEEQV